MRRRQADKRTVIADPKYNSVIVTKFINIVMIEGKKSTAEKIVYDALEAAEKKLNSPAIDILKKAMDNARPLVVVKSRRVGGATYQVPIEVPEDRGISIAMRWIRDYARNKKGSPMAEKLCDEILLAYKGEGSAIKKRDDTHKMAEANKAFAHYRW
jgi:small subunit ribosomal protein S7